MAAHRVLGVSENASAAEIKRAYRELAKTCHPDRGGSEEEFNRIHSAYEEMLEALNRPKIEPIVYNNPADGPASPPPRPARPFDDLSRYEKKSTYSFQGRAQRSRRGRSRSTIDPELIRYFGITAAAIFLSVSGTTARFGYVGIQPILGQILLLSIALPLAAWIVALIYSSERSNATIYIVTVFVVAFGSIFINPQQFFSEKAKEATHKVVGKGPR